MFKPENLLKIVRAGVYLALLAPLVYIPQTIFPAVFGKMIYFQIVIESALPFYLYLIFFHKEFRPKFRGLSAIILVFFSALFLSSLLGADWLRSFWGYDERMRGLFTLLHFLFFYLFIIAAFRTAKDRKNLLLFFIVAGVAAALFGVAERINPSLNIDKTTVKSREGHRIMSTTGNSIFLAGYMLFVAFLSFYYFLAYRDRSRWAALLACVLGALDVMFTGTRGAFLGLVAGALIYLTVLFFISGKKYKIIFGSATATIAMFVFLTLVANVKILKQNRYWDFDRLTSISFSDASARDRLLLWKTAFVAFREHPILGWGMENFHYGFDRNYNPELLQSGVSQTFADRAHNLFLDWLVMAGLPGLVLYLAIWFVIAKKIFKKENFSKANLVLFALIAAFSIHSFFAIEDPTVNTAMFFFFAFCSLIFWPDTRAAEAANRKKISLPLLLIGSLVLIYFYNVKPLQAGTAYIEFWNAGNIQEKKQAALKMLALATPYADNFRFRFANATFFDAGTNIAPAYAGWAMDTAIEEMGKTLMRHPADFSYFHTLGNLYLREGSRKSDAGLLKRAIEFYNQALALSPKRQATMFQLATTYLLAGRAGDAVDLLKQAVSFNQALGQPHWRLAVALLSDGQKEEAYKEFKNSIKIGFFDTIDNELKQAASLCAGFKDYGCAASVYEVLTAKNPNNADLYAQLAAAYAAAGRYGDARNAVLKAVGLDPSLSAEAKIFLKQIGY